MRRVAVLGAGAAGYTAAITAARAGADVVLINAESRTARKVLASGNGRCNMGNTQVDVGCYRTSTPERLPLFLVRSSMVEAFWRSLGVLTRTDDEGRVYPWSNRAQSVADSLRLTAEQCGVTLCVGEVLSLQKGETWTIRTSAGDVAADAVVVALGSPAASSVGGTDAGVRLARTLSVPCAPFRPSLVPLCTAPHHASLKGCRQQAVVTLTADGISRAERGEVLFTDYGVSGIAVMQLSAFYAGEGAIHIDLLPSLTAKEVYDMVRARVASGRYPTVDVLMTGVLDKLIAYALLKDAHISPLSLRTDTLTSAQIDSLCRMLKDWTFAVTGTLGLDAAQVAAGGVLLSAVDDDLMSRKHRGLYFAGEVLDVTGLCGGYNLHWAWLSGLIAGRAAAFPIGNS